MQEQKTQLRRQFRQYRDDIDATTREWKNRAILARLQALPEIIEADSVFSYISMGKETDTRLLLDWLLEKGKQVAVPKITGDGQMIAIPFTGWANLQAGMLGVLTPEAADGVDGSFDISITPGLAYTISGTRLGQGQAYYDRWFATRQVRYKIAPAFECQITGTLPADRHDVTVDIIITEQRIIRVS